MRRMRSGAGGTLHANRANAGTPDPLSLIRSFDSENIPTRPVRPSPLSASTFHGLPLDLLDRLRSFPLFLSAPDSFLAAIGSHLRPQLHNPHDYILTEGDDAKAMYWLVRGSLIVTSRDGESTYAELKPGAFFGEIGILMDIPRTATVVAKLKSLVVRLNKEDLQKVLPNYPEVESAIRDEALERLSILERKKKELNTSKGLPATATPTRKGKRPRSMDGEVVMAEAGMLKHGEVVVSSKKRKSPSPSITDTLASSALGSGSVNVRLLLRELPLFATLPPEILHFIGLNAYPCSYPPFTNIIKQGSTGRDVFFIVRGEVEVVAEKFTPQLDFTATKGAPILLLPPEPPAAVARLRPGQYFGEVTSLSLAPKRTATVRSISSVEALMISGDILDELWQKCSPDLRRQVERTARDRLRSAQAADNDVHMTDADSTPAIGSLELDDVRPLSPSTKGLFSLQETLRVDEPPAVGTLDPDPYLNIDLENVRSRSRRGSLAPPSPSTSTPPNEPDQQGDSPSKLSLLNGHSLLSQLKFKIDPVSPRKVLASKRARLLRQKPKVETSSISDDLLIRALKYIDLYELMKLRLVSKHWLELITTSPDILHYLDLTPYNRWVNDQTVVNTICPFVGTRPKFVDISNCFHLTDEGFTALSSTCAPTAKTWKMKSVWDITGQAVLEMTNKAKELEEIDLSNCRKVSDNLLARVVGWVVPALDPVEQVVQQQRQQQQLNRRNSNSVKLGKLASPPPQLPAPGTVVGCPSLKRMTLSYCKHITDRSMAHIATHAATRIEELNLTRCTTITDEGFHFWSAWAFPHLTRLCLADCTYLTDNAIIWLTHAARALKWLDLSFCCALSDIATEVLALGCPSLQHLNLAFCGSAVSDASLRVMSRHLLELRQLSVRGCVRVTGVGVESVVDGCERLEALDVSQCRNLLPWIDAGGRERVQAKGRSVKFCVWAGEEGEWATGDPWVGKDREREKMVM